MENNETSEASSAVLSTAELGAAVIVRGVVVAWFSAWDDAARDWCTANHFGEWLAWQAKKPELIRLTDEQIARIKADAADMAAKFKEASNVELTGAARLYRAESSD